MCTRRARGGERVPCETCVRAVSCVAAARRGRGMGFRQESDTWRNSRLLDLSDEELHTRVIEEPFRLPASAGPFSRKTRKDLLQKREKVQSGSTTRRTRRRARGEGTRSRPASSRDARVRDAFSRAPGARAPRARRLPPPPGRRGQARARPQQPGRSREERGRRPGSGRDRRRVRARGGAPARAAPAAVVAGVAAAALLAHASPARSARTPRSRRARAPRASRAPSASRSSPRRRRASSTPPLERPGRRSTPARTSAT